MIFSMVMFVWFDYLRPSQQFFNYVRTGPTGLNQYCDLLKDTTQRRRWGSNPEPLDLKNSTLPLNCSTPIFIDGT